MFVHYRHSSGHINPYFIFFKLSVYVDPIWRFLNFLFSMDFHSHIFLLKLGLIECRRTFIDFD